MVNSYIHLHDAKDFYPGLFTGFYCDNFLRALLIRTTIQLLLQAISNKSALGGKNGL